jgi:hypothetical protein
MGAPQLVVLDLKASELLFFRTSIEQPHQYGGWPKVEQLPGTTTLLIRYGTLQTRPVPSRSTQAQPSFLFSLLKFKNASTVEEIPIEDTVDERYRPHGGKLLVWGPNAGQRWLRASTESRHQAPDPICARSRRRASWPLALRERAWGEGFRTPS